MAAAIKILRTVQDVRDWRRECSAKNESVGFVPTMGALHEGHCLLVTKSLEENDRTIVSIFVNPSQFAPTEDLEDYPRTLDTDMSILEETFKEKQVDAVFVPKVAEMYPNGIDTDVTKQKGAFVKVLGCSEQLEGVTRPNFFRGVATVVTKLLNVVRPDLVYFGQKDAQQCVVIKNLVQDLLIDTVVRVLPTKREKSMLAMSSRNAYLSPEIKEESAVIYKSLKRGEKYYTDRRGSSKIRTSDVINEAKSELAGHPTLVVDYVSVNHPETLAELEFIDEAEGALLSLAVFAPRADGDKARLIDNIILH